MIPRLETRRLLLRPVEQADAIATANIMDRHVARYLLSWPADLSVEDCRIRIKAARKALSDREDVAFAISNKEDGRLMGWISLARNPADPARARLGYWISAADEGRGYMKEAVAAFLSVAASYLQISIVDASAHADNPASIAILKRQGFTFERTEQVRFPASGAEESVEVYQKTLS